MSLLVIMKEIDYLKMLTYHKSFTLFRRHRTAYCVSAAPRLGHSVQQ